MSFKIGSSNQYSLNHTVSFSIISQAMPKVLDPLYLCNQNFCYSISFLLANLQTFYVESIYEFVNFSISLAELFNLHHYLLIHSYPLFWKFGLNLMFIELKEHSSSFLNDLFSSLLRPAKHLALHHLHYLFLPFYNTIFIDMLI